MRYTSFETRPSGGPLLRVRCCAHECPHPDERAAGPRLEGGATDETPTNHHATLSAARPTAYYGRYKRLMPMAAASDESGAAPDRPRSASRRYNSPRTRTLLKEGLNPNQAARVGISKSKSYLLGQRAVEGGVGRVSDCFCGRNEGLAWWRIAIHDEPTAMDARLINRRTRRRN